MNRKPLYKRWLFWVAIISIIAFFILFISLKGNSSIEISNVILQSDSGAAIVYGEAANKEAEACSFSLKADLFDKNNKLLGTVEGTVNNLNGKSSRIFSVVAGSEYSNADYCKVKLDKILSRGKNKEDLFEFSDYRIKNAEGKTFIEGQVKNTDKVPHSFGVTVGLYSGKKLVGVAVGAINDIYSNEKTGFAAISSKSVESAVECKAYADSLSSVTLITNQNWINSGREGDADGPAWVVYSKMGYNAAAANFELSKLQSNLVRKSDNLAVASYLFLGVNVFENNDHWINCADAGLCLKGNGKWHAFINRYEPTQGEWYQESTWWESDVNLDKTHDYRLVLKTSENDGKMTLEIYDITSGDVLSDSKTVDFYSSKKDGTNTAYYRDLAIDFPPEVCKAKNGDYTDDWTQVLEYNTNENLYMKNIHVNSAELYNLEGKHRWTDEYTSYRFLWPDTNCKVNYACTTVNNIKRDYEDILNMDMNHSSGVQK